MFELFGMIMFWWILLGIITFCTAVVWVPEDRMPDWLGYLTVIGCGPLAWLFICVLTISAHRSGRMWRSL